MICFKTEPDSENTGFINFKSGGDMNGNGKIWRDNNGICHIEAENKSDAYRLMGVAHGRDRGMQAFWVQAGTLVSGKFHPDITHDRLSYTGPIPRRDGTAFDRDDPGRAG